MFGKLFSFWKKPVQVVVEPEKKPQEVQIKKAKPEVRKGKEEEISKKELELVKILEDIHKREVDLEKRAQSLDSRETYLRNTESEIKRKEADIENRLSQADKLKMDRTAKLKEVAGLSSQEAKEIVMEQTNKELVSWKAKKINETNEAIKAQEEEISRDVLSEALRHATTDFVAEYTVSTIPVNDENLKGKIIGREGRNIRSFERATGVELELDEEKEIRISSFDAIRREIAKISLQKLLKDGRIQPARIEEVVAQTKSQMDRILLEEGKKICQSVGVFNLPVDLIKVIGRYKFRFSYGQNLAIHTIEVTKIAVKLAHELGADVKTVRLGGLLHDIGKVISDEEGGHVQVGIDYLKKYKIPQPILDCVAEHHEDKGFTRIESALVWVGDAASGSRPGARYQMHEEYIKRLSAIEEKVKSFDGIEDVAAYQAGREIRVIVSPEKVRDDELVVLVQDIAKKLDEEAKWAGQIKITAIRENRKSAIAPLRKQ
jgi:ribonuclease Y